MDAISYTLASKLKDYIKTKWDNLNTINIFYTNAAINNVIINNKIYYFSKNELYIYDLLNNTSSSTLRYDNLIVRGGFCVNDSNYIYIVTNGTENSKNLKVYRYSIISNIIQEIYSTDAYDANYSTGVIKDGVIYIHNLGNPGLSEKTLLKFDTSLFKITKLADSNYSRIRGNCVLKDNFIYVFGGQGSDIHAEKYSIQNNVWSIIADLPMKSTFNFSTLFYNKIHIMLGDKSDMHLVYDDLKNVYIKEMPTPDILNVFGAYGLCTAYASNNQNIITILNYDRSNNKHYILSYAINELNNLKSYIASN